MGRGVQPDGVSGVVVGGRVLPSLARFSAAEWLVALFLLFCLAYVAYYARKLVRGEDVRDDGAQGDGADAAGSRGCGAILYRAVVGALAVLCMVTSPSPPSAA